MRATTSSAPPAANGTTSRTDLSGYAAAVCAREADANVVSASAAASAASFCMREKPIGAAIPKKLPSMYPVYYRECFTVTARLAHEKNGHLFPFPVLAVGIYGRPALSRAYKKTRPRCRGATDPHRAAQRRNSAPDPARRAPPLS